MAALIAGGPSVADGSCPAARLELEQQGACPWTGRPVLRCWWLFMRPQRDNAYGCFRYEPMGAERKISAKQKELPIWLGLG